MDGLRLAIMAIAEGVFVSANSLLDDAIADVGLDEVRLMPLEAGDLPPPFENYDLSRESDLDNRTMARFGFPGSSEERFREAGRIGGYMREMLSAVPSFGSDGADFMLSTVAHLFHTPEDVLGWMHDVFLRDFEANVGVEIGSGQRLVGARRLEPEGFYDESVGLRALHEDGDRLVSVTIVDFRVGRILGVAFVGTLGEHTRLERAQRLGYALERRIVSVALGER